MLRHRASRCLCRLVSSQAASPTSATSAAEKFPFTLPKKIKRGPTDLLKALAETVREDPTAPHYGFIDDPTLIPTQDRLRSTSFLAREMGRRAAREIAAEWPTLFMYDRDEPRLNAFRPTKLVPVDQVEPNELNLRARIDAKRVTDAAALYERMRSANMDVAADLQMDLFELIAFYNGADPPLVESELPGMRTFHADGALFQKTEGQPSMWATGGVADLLFEMLDQNDSRVCSIMIAGLCKYRSDAAVKRAWTIMQTMRSNGLKPTIEAYEWMLRACFQIDDQRPVGEFVTLLLNNMAEDGIRPTVQIFNAALLTMTDNPDMVKQLFGEMVALGIEPSLTTFRLVLGSSAVPNAEAAVNYLHQMLTKLEGRDEIVVVQRTDFEFYLVAMEIALKANCLSLGERIETLYRSQKNKVALPGLVDGDDFFSDYLRLLMSSVQSNRMSIEEFDKRYRTLVPRHIAPKMALMHELVDLLDNHYIASLALRFIEDIIGAGLLLTAPGTRRVFRMLNSANPKTLSITEFEAMETVLLQVVDTLNGFASVPNLKFKKKWTSQNLCAAAQALARFGHTARAWELFSKLMPVQSSFAATTDTMEMEKASQSEIEDFGELDTGASMELFNIALATNDFVNACNCVEIFAHHNRPIDRMVSDIKSRLSLAPQQLRIIENFARLRSTR